MRQIGLALIFLGFFANPSFAQKNKAKPAIPATLEISSGVVIAEAGSNFVSREVAPKSLMTVPYFTARWQSKNADLFARSYLSESIFSNGVGVYAFQNNIFKLRRIRFSAGLEYNKDTQSEELVDDEVFVINGYYDRHYAAGMLGAGIGEKQGKHLYVYYLAGADYRNQHIKIYHQGKRYNDDGRGKITNVVQPIQGLRVYSQYSLPRKITVNVILSRTEPFVKKSPERLVGKKTIAAILASYSLTNKLKGNLSGSWSDNKTAIEPFEKSVSFSVVYQLRKK